MKQRIIWKSCFVLLILLTACQPATTPTEPPVSTTEKETKPTESTNTLPEEKKEESLVKQIYDAAKEGRLIFESFPIGTPVQKVLDEWGTPESGDPSYLGYEKSKNCGFFSKDTQQISGIRSVHPQLKNIRYDQITEELGEPEQKGSEWGSKYISYKAGDYQISFYYTGDEVKSIYLGKS